MKPFGRGQGSIALMETTAKLEVVVLGTGAGSTSTLTGEPSSSFGVTIGGRCEILVDLGFGVTRAFLERFGELPSRVFITHNHSDHAAELPIVSMLSRARGRDLTVYSAPEVEHRLRLHRFHEFAEAGLQPEDLVSWVTCLLDRRLDLRNGLSIELRQGLHSECSFGFRLFYEERPVLGYSGDSGFSYDFFEWLAAAPVVIADGREAGGPEHAGFTELEAFAATRPDLKLWVTHYGRADQAPARLSALRAGLVLSLGTINDL